VCRHVENRPEAAVARNNPSRPRILSLVEHAGFNSFQQVMLFPALEIRRFSRCGLLPYRQRIGSDEDPSEDNIILAVVEIVVGGSLCFPHASTKIYTVVRISLKRKPLMTEHLHVEAITCLGAGVGRSNRPDPTIGIREITKINRAQFCDAHTNVHAAAISLQSSRFT
jgi:hypothetical protein